MQKFEFVIILLVFKTDSTKDIIKAKKNKHIENYKDLKIISYLIVFIVKLVKIFVVYKFLVYLKIAMYNSLYFEL